MEKVYGIRHLVLAEGWGIRRAAREFGVSRNSVRRYLAGAEPGVRKTAERARPVFDGVRSRIDEILADSASHSRCSGDGSSMSTGHARLRVASPTCSGRSSGSASGRSQSRSSARSATGRRSPSRWPRSRRHRQTGSVVVTTNLAFSEWPQVFAGDEKLATALTDRFADRGTIITTKSKSFRLQRRRGREPEASTGPVQTEMAQD